MGGHGSDDGDSRKSHCSFDSGDYRRGRRRRDMENRRGGWQNRVLEVSAVAFLTSSSVTRIEAEDSVVASRREKKKTTYEM